MKSQLIIMSLFLSYTMALFPADKWQTVMTLQRELGEKHKLTVFSIARTAKSVDYVFVGKNTIIRTKVYKDEFLAEHNLGTQETRIIPPPKELRGKKLSRRATLYYDETSKTIHTQIAVITENGKNPIRYYLLHLENYTWEEIPELQNLVHQITYNPNTKHLYVDTANRRENILIFNMESRKFIGEIDIIGRSSSVHAMYGEPLHVLCGIEIYGKWFYHLFDTGSRTGKIFPKEEYNTDDTALGYYIHIENQRFLYANMKGQDNDVFVDLNLETGRKKILFPEPLAKEIYNLKKVDETHYSFLIDSDDNYKLLCIMEYR